MYSFEATNVSQALAKGIDYLLNEGIEEPSRNGPVIVAPGPVCTVYTQPRRRVLFSPTRDANPFFHLMESLWILSGACDVEFVEFFAKQMRAYSDDGITSWGAYGHRWRNFFGWDQLEAVVRELQINLGSRRCVIAMWNAWPQAGDYDQNRGMNRDNPDLHDHDFRVGISGGLDVPCNTHAYVDCRGGKLNLTICNRSNDIIWGCYGANAVHFSFLQEYLAMRIGVPIGEYRQFSNNYHAYTNVFDHAKLTAIATECREEEDLGGYPALGPALEPGFDVDLTRFMLETRAAMHSDVCLTGPYQTTLMQTVAAPVFHAWHARKNKADLQTQLDLANAIDAPDWRRACTEWIQRRKK